MWRRRPKSDAEQRRRRARASSAGPFSAQQPPTRARRREREAVLGTAGIAHGQSTIGARKSDQAAATPAGVDQPEASVSVVCTRLPSTAGRCPPVPGAARPAGSGRCRGSRRRVLKVVPESGGPMGVSRQRNVKTTAHDPPHKRTPFASGRVHPPTRRGGSPVTSHIIRNQHSRSAARFVRPCYPVLGRPRRHISPRLLLPRSGRSSSRVGAQVAGARLSALWMQWTLCRGRAT